MKRLITALLLVSGLMVLTPVASVHADDPFKGVKCGADRGTTNSVVCKDKTNKNPLVGEDGLILRIANIVGYLAGAIAVIMIIIAGIKFVTANGDSNAISSAKSTIISALIGLAVILLAGTIINYVVLRL